MRGKIGPVKKGALTAKIGKPSVKKENAIASKKVGAKVKIGGETKKVTTKLKREAVFAKNAKKWNHSRKK